MDYRKKILDTYISSSYGTVHKNLLKFSLGNDLARNFIFFKHNYLKLLPKKKNVKILELGPGMGQFLHFLKENNYHDIIGIDGSKEVANYCKIKGFDVRCIDDFMSFFRQEENAGRFDVIIANDIFEHFYKDELFKILTTLKQNLKDGGSIIAKTPNGSSCFMGSYGRYCDFTHEIIFTEKSVKQIFYSIGYSKIEIFEPNLFCFYLNPLNYVGWFLTFFVKYFQIVIHRLNGNFDTKIVSANIIFKATK